MERINYFRIKSYKPPTIDALFYLYSKHFIIIKGESNEGKTTLSRAIHKFLKEKKFSPFLFSFDKIYGNIESYTCTKNFSKEYNLQKYDNNKICDYILNEEMIFIIEKILDKKYTHFIFDLDDENKFFEFLMSLEEIKKNFDSFLREESLKRIENIISKLSLKIKQNFLNVFVFGTFNKWKNYYFNNNNYNFQNLYVITKEQSQENNLYLNNKINHNLEDILRNMMILNVKESFDLVHDFYIFLRNSNEIK